MIDQEKPILEYYGNFTGLGVYYILRFNGEYRRIESDIADDILRDTIDGFLSEWKSKFTHKDTIMKMVTL